MRIRRIDLQRRTETEKDAHGIHIERASNTREEEIDQTKEIMTNHFLLFLGHTTPEYNEYGKSKAERKTNSTEIY
jgi:hypothetical protein